MNTYTKIIHVIFVPILLMVIQCSCYGGDDKKPLDVLGELVTYYYTSPTKERFDEINNHIDKNIEEIKTLDNGFSRNLVFFLCIVSNEHKYKISGKSPLQPIAQEILDSKWKELEAIFNDVKKVNVDKLDVWWICFFATGHKKYLDYIYSQTQIEPDNNMKNMIKMAARWSFKANCKQHKDVLQYAKVIQKDNGNDFINECIIEAEK